MQYHCTRDYDKSYDCISEIVFHVKTFWRKKLPRSTSTMTSFLKISALIFVVALGVYCQVAAISNATTTAPPTTKNITTTAKSTTTTAKSTTTTAKSTTTTAKSTTTTAKSTTTTAKPKPTTTTAKPKPTTTMPKPTTTTPLPHPSTRFELIGKDNKTVCIILDAAIEIKVLYEKNDGNHTLSKPFFIPVNASVSGKCSTNKSSQAEMVLQFNGQKVTFIFVDKSKEVTLDKVSMAIMTTGADFPDAKNTNKSTTFSAKANLDPTKDNTYYYCHSDDNVHFADNKTLLTLRVNQLQAFNVKDNNVTGEGSLCMRDRTSTTATPTTTMKPIPNPPPIQNNFTVKENHTVCIYMQAAFQISVMYTNNKNKNVTRLFNIPKLVNDDTDVKGNCNTTLYSNPAQELEIFFYNSWSLKMVFTKPKSKSTLLSADDSKFSLNEVIVKLDLNTTMFPDAMKNQNLSASVSNLTYFGGNNGGAFKCNSNQTIMSNQMGISLFSSDLMYKAFGTSNSTDFGSDVSECPDDEETNSTVPIAVGAALAGLVVIVLIAYLIGRKRSRRAGYESV
ncbi:lysosome-associated membrane glycoprotein 1-like isoform X2 [Gigantopelta aegis]|uniref:lysosome-associated membrane glycoprotein 1-like isoform X2 n=1 Tax=Gigantopelta aegis TaxID=1735272 RepID=UPI001B88C2F7|nr:lysosome-associated membrane glycoprotein 1-like isoform X2 [Gigantopelta aegis]